MGAESAPFVFNSFCVIIKNMECRQKNNLKVCPCTYPDCENKGICCLCIKYHRDKKELPACPV